MAQFPFVLYVSLYQFDDARISWRVHYQHHSRVLEREATWIAPPDLGGIETFADALLVALCATNDSPFLPTIRLRTPATSAGGEAQLSFNPAWGDGASA